MNKPLRLTDIVVFDGIISTYGVLSPLVELDEIRLATKEEIDLYKNRPDL